MLQIEAKVLKYAMVIYHILFLKRTGIANLAWDFPVFLRKAIPLLVATPSSLPHPHAISIMTMGTPPKRGRLGVGFRFSPVIRAFLFL